MKNKHKKCRINAKIYPDRVDGHCSIKLSSFTKKVLNAVCTIPLGQTRSYKWVAEQVGQPKAMRAVGGALNRNPFPVLIPCHRVIRKDGNIGGYSRGRIEKEKLLKLEKEISLICRHKT
jgi:methylated-DNA-[protein]-cysteine S-methyltransferase